jgi:hypothetical protein
MDSPGNHPSYLELDRVRLGAASRETATHLEGCERCRAHLRTLEAPVPIPPWARELANTPKPGWRFWTKWRLPMAGLVPVAFAALLLAVVIPRLHLVHPSGELSEETASLGDKGVPAVMLHIARGEQISLWDGQSPVQPGDKLQLEVNGEGFGYVQVAAGKGAKAQVLYAGPLDPKRSTLLPTSWRVDAEPGNEELEVVMSRGPLTPEELEAALSTPRRDRTLWTTTLVLPKSKE